MNQDTARSTLAHVVHGPEGSLRFSSPFTSHLPHVPEGATVGDVYAVDRLDPHAAPQRLAKAGTARAQVYLVALEVLADPSFPEEVQTELRALDLEASLEDPSLTDLTAVPFVTIDGPTSRDLDQALFVERAPNGGFVVQYALADAAYFVPKHGAIFTEALRRGASVYLPGFSIPMLPRELSEGIVSLNPDGPRRALVFRVAIDREGKTLETKVVRAKVESRAKLSFPEVQAFYDGAPEGAHLASSEAKDALLALREVGEALMGEAAARDVARYRRGETELRVEGPEGETLSLVASPRARVEMYNEQLSLLVNREGARLLLESPEAHVQPIFRVHPSPPEERLALLCETLAAILEVHGLGKDSVFAFDPEKQSLAHYLSNLPTTGREGRIADAIHRQAIVVNARSSFSADVGAHHGVGAEAYARFSAPMREIVGIFVHHEMLEHLTGQGPIDETLREKVVVSANQSKDVQRKANDLVGKLFLDALFGKDLTLPVASRPRRRGTVMGFTSSKLHVSLEDPPLDVKLYLRDVGRLLGGKWLLVADAGASLREKETQDIVLRLGDEVTVYVEGRDVKQDRWVLALGEPPKAGGEA